MTAYYYVVLVCCLLVLFECFFWNVLADVVSMCFWCTIILVFMYVPESMLAGNGAGMRASSDICCGGGS